MALMVWDEHFITGIDAIDAQHKALFDMVNAVARLLAAAGEGAANDVKPLFDQLADYALTHSKYEEEMMHRAGIAPGYLEQQRRGHDSFDAEVARMRQEAGLEHKLPGNDLLRFLAGWLTFHIVAEDQCMARQLRAIEAGTPPELAWQAAVADGNAANSLLTRAMLDLFGLYIKRNQTLVEVNQELRAAQAELAVANRKLEARVEAGNEALQREKQALIESLARIERTQGQLLQSEKMAAVGQLAAGVAHEINNPVGFVNSNLGSLASYIDRLFSVIGAYETLEAALPPEHPARVAVGEARQAAELDYLRVDIPDLLRESSEGLVRVKRIVSDLKDFSHVDEAEWQKVDLNRGLESTLNVVWNEIKYKAEVTKDFGDLPPVNCIPAQINQVFMNLLVNAAQAIETAGKITLRTGVDGDEAWVEIADTGKGMSEEVRARIFEPFYTTKPVGQGTGLGLSISWDIVQRHGGQIAVRSSPGQGCVFRIQLPIDGQAGEGGAGGA